MRQHEGFPPGQRKGIQHRIGLHKMGFLLDEAGAGAVDMMRTVKRAHDMLETTLRSINPHMNTSTCRSVVTC